MTNERFFKLMRGKFTLTKEEYTKLFHAITNDSFTIDGNHDFFCIRVRDALNIISILCENVVEVTQNGKSFSIKFIDHPKDIKKPGE